MISLLKRIQQSESTFLIFAAVLIGLLAGSANILFRTTMQFVHRFIFVGGSQLLHIADGGWHRLFMPLLPVAGALLLLPFIRRFPGEAGGYGFPRFIETVNVKGGYLRIRNIMLKTIGPALTIGSGGSAGVEGPIAIIGGTIGSSIARSFKVSGGRIKLLIAAGAAGGVAATFNAPIAGVMFASEIVLLGDYEISSFAAIVISSGIATVMSRWYYGATPAFTVPQYDLRSVAELPLYLLLGIIIGLTAVLTIRMFYGIKDRIDASGFHPLLKPVAGAFIVGCIGIVLPQVMGNGYEFIDEALHERPAFFLLAALVLFKIIATSVTLGSGGAGGMFAPSLFIGAMTGGSFGVLVHGLFPSFTATPGAYATVGIGAFLAAVTHAPLTGIFLLFEMTGNYQIIVPLMITAIIGTVVAKGLQKDSIDTVELTRKGVHIHEGREVSVMSRLHVADVMVPGALSVPRSTTLKELIDIMIERDRFYLPVVDEQGRLSGIVSIQDVRPVLLDDRVVRIVNAGDIATESVITVTPRDDLNSAMGKFSIKDIDEIPVVDHTDGLRVIGMLKRRDVIAAYNRAVLTRESGRDAWDKR
ncbi:MAG: chloride channel protein [Nitrospirota bacterium]|nr:chloride channel protein [Nitrospirota bacterium]